MKCVLHIGTEKTGTTLLQQWLYDNEQEFRQQGIYLPEGFGSTNKWHFPVYFSNSLDHFYIKKQAIRDVEEFNAFFNDFDITLQKEVAKAAGCTTFLITSEHFHSALTDELDISKLRDYLKKYFSSFRIICYFRNQADLALSLYSTALKGGETRDFNTFINSLHPDRHYFNHQIVAKKWSRVFGRENCEFRVYNRDDFVERDIRADFLSTLGKMPKKNQALL